MKSRGSGKYTCGPSQKLRLRVKAVVKVRTSCLFSLFFAIGYLDKKLKVLDCNKNYLNAQFQAFKPRRKLPLNRTMS